VLMNDRLEWTQKLGDAVLAQQKDVAASIQRLRKLSHDSGKLKTSDQQKVTTQPGTPPTIIIEPANPQAVYVPVYEPGWAYGPWPYPAYPPYYYPPVPGYGYGTPLLSGFMFGVGIAAAGSMFGGWNWGSGDMNVNVNRAINIDRNFDGGRYQNGRWGHQVDHRRGVGYRDAGTRQRYGKNVPGADARRDYRGKDLTRPVGAGGQRPGGQVGGGHRPTGGQLGGGQRPGGGQLAGGHRPGGQVGGGQGPGGHRPAGGQLGGGHQPGGGVYGGGSRGGALGGVDRGGSRVNREAARGRSSYGGSRGGGGGRGGGGRGGGGRR
jgi:hypothetical protein